MLCLQGIAPLLPIFRESILNGAPDLKESAGNGLGEIIKLTSVDGAALSSNVDLLFAMFHIEVHYLKESKVTSCIDVARTCTTWRVCLHSSTPRCGWRV